MAAAQTVIWIQPYKNNQTVSSVRDAPAAGAHPFNVKDVSTIYTCALDERRMRIAGTKIFNALRKHPVIRDELFKRVIHKNPRPDEQHAIYFLVDQDEADELPFEALYHSACGFLALSENWPIARMQKQESGTTARDHVHDFFYPLRFMAVLSSTSAEDGKMPSARDQWLALQPALRRGAALLERNWKLKRWEALEVLVLTNDQFLIDEINEQAHREHNARDRPWISAEQIGQDADTLKRKREAFRPHLLHLFCHGFAGQTPRLSFGTRGDFLAKQPGSIQVAPVDLSERDPACWIVTLNSCSGAANTGGLHSFAKSLVRSGTPTAVGMREPIDEQHAAILSGEFYDRVFDRISDIDATRDRSVSMGEEIDWSFALQKVRDQMRNRTHKGEYEPHDCRHWAIPVLYRTTDPFRVRFCGERDEKSVHDLKSLDQIRGLFENVKLLEERKRQRQVVAGGLVFDGLDKVLRLYDEEIAKLEKSLWGGA